MKFKVKRSKSVTCSRHRIEDKMADGVAAFQVVRFSTLAEIHVGLVVLDSIILTKLSHLDFGLG